MNKTVGWTFMSTEPKPTLRDNDSDSFSCLVLKIKYQPGGHKCPPYGTYLTESTNAHPTEL